MNILTKWLRSYLPELPVDDRQLAEDLTLRGIAVEGEFDAACGGKLFEMDITTNRVDAMNHYGIAREAAAIYGLELKSLSRTAESTVDAVRFPLRVDALDLCGSFSVRVIRGVTVGPSTGIVAEYFAALGIKAISAPVDITNFCLFAMGHPTHVFDLDKIEGGINVRRAFAGEKLRLLDGTERTLVTEDLVVADDVKALGLAGVMGGWDARVTDQTRNIVVEAAWFEPATIRASSRRHGLHTDASHRFERGADFAATSLASNLVTSMIVEQCGGDITGPFVQVAVHTAAEKTVYRKPVRLSLDEVTRHLGTTLDGAGIPAKVVERFLTALGCVLEATTETCVYAVTLPSWRLDLEREIDLIEEVARVYGYNRFADTLPGFTGAVVEQPHVEQERAMRRTLRARGFSEAISSTFVAEQQAETFGGPAGSVAMGNPLSAEAGMLRPSLVPGMVTMLAHNLHRDVSDVRLFELGTVFTGSIAQVDEAAGLALGASGAAAASSLHSSADALFFELKGAIEALLASFAGAVTFDAQQLPGWIEPGRGARALLDGAPVAWFGELASGEAQRHKLRQTCVLAEVIASTLLAQPLRQPLTRELSRFQSVQRDFSFVFPDAVRWASVDAAVRGLEIDELQRVTPVEVFRDAKGKAVDAGSYSILVRVLFQSAEHTLTDEELTASAARVTAALTALGGVQRV